MADEHTTRGNPQIGDAGLLDEIADLRGGSPPLTFSLRAQTPIEKTLDEHFAKYQMAVQAGDRNAQELLLEEIDRQLQHLQDSDGDGYRNGAWLIANMRCSRAGLVKDYQKALQFARAAESAALDDKEKSIALHNQAGPLICLGRLQEAIQLELAALRRSPGNAGFWANLCEALYLNSQYVEASRILATVPDANQDASQASVWKVILENDPCFVGMASDSSKSPAYTACRNLRERLGLV